MEGLELAYSALPRFDLQSFREGHLSPVFFGSALRNFGVEQLLDAIGAWAPGPLPRKAEQRLVDPAEKNVTGFIFKVQANMDPNHRDRIAFMRLCSGHFRRGMKLFNVREKRSIAVNAPILFFAQQRETTDEAYAGDIIGIPNHGTIRVGDTFTEGEVLKYQGIPNFAPELLRRVALEDAMKTKQLNRALHDLAEEGVVQVFYPLLGQQQILGVVGALQLDVLQSRLQQEYGVDVRYEPVSVDSRALDRNRRCRRPAPVRRAPPRQGGEGPRRSARLSAREPMGPGADIEGLARIEVRGGTRERMTRPARAAS